jgi:hypothetical protein
LCPEYTGSEDRGDQNDNGGRTKNIRSKNVRTHAKLPDNYSEITKFDATIGSISQIFRNNNTIQPVSELYAPSELLIPDGDLTKISDFSAFDVETGDWFANGSEY